MTLLQNRENGIKAKTRPDTAVDEAGSLIEGVTNPDIWIGDQLWEIKSPKDGERPPKPENLLRFIEAQIDEARKNFRNPYDEVARAPMADSHPVRVVLNPRYKSGFESPDSEVLRKVVRRMRPDPLRGRKAVDDVLVIFGNGEIRHVVRMNTRSG